MAGTGHYNTKGLYNHYDKNHKERDALDYYATPTDEVFNILTTLNYDFSNTSILEPCCGEGHMLQGIKQYLDTNNQQNVEIIATDVQKRINKFGFDNSKQGIEYDFLSDDYPITKADWIIMNPPYATIEPFIIRALEIAQKGIIMLGRIQFIEGANRYTNILQDNPFTYSYTYVDRIQCWKNGEKPSGSSAQGYSWFIWDFDTFNKEPIQRWIRRYDKVK